MDSWTLKAYINILNYNLQVVNGYFTHFFAPVGIAPLRKRILFVLDVSGSMSFGRKIIQLKEAMTHILQELNEDDLFNIITFESTSLAWSKYMKKATPENIDAATEMVQDLTAEGGISNDLLSMIFCDNSGIHFIIS